jgi:hypothetical protein
MGNHRAVVCSYRGTVRDVFGRRFVLATDDGPILADIGRSSRDKLGLKVGETINVSGQPVASEVKVHFIQRGRGKVFAFQNPPKRHPQRSQPELEAAANVALDAGYMVVGEPIHRGKHIELQCIRGHHRYELHVMPNGDIRKEKVLDN